MTLEALAGFLRRELAPTPGRAEATFRLTIACVIATIPILTHRIPLALVVMIVMYLVTQEDTAATVIGSILAAIGVTVGLGAALLVWMVVLDIAWLRIACFIGFLFLGLFLKRVLAIGALGSAIGLPAALVMMVPDIAPLPPEGLVEFLLWLWFCLTLGLAVNVGVQLVLAPDDPLTLLHRELDVRLRIVEEVLRRLSDGDELPPARSAVSLESLTTAGMSRPLALLKTATLTNARARARHDTLATMITLTDRLVTDASALRPLVPPTAPAASLRRDLQRVADGCGEARRALFGEPSSAMAPLPLEILQSGAAPTPLLADLARTLEQLSVAIRARVAIPSTRAAKPPLLLPDALTNPEYVRFAIKGSVAALICYVLLVGFDYAGIYTSVITCFVVSLSTIGSSNQKGVLRFGGAAVGGAMGLVALVYAFPNVERLGGFWAVFAAGTAVAAWINFGSPRIAYAGYQTGLAFYKAIFQGFGPVLSATVVRDRLIGIVFGLVVFGIVEHLLWPVRAAERMHTQLADVFRSLAAFARVASRPREDSIGADARRMAIAQQVADVHGLIESSKFEPGAAALDAQLVERLTGDAQMVFLSLLAIAHHAASTTPLPPATRAATSRVDSDIAAFLEDLAARVESGHTTAAMEPPAEVAAPLEADVPDAGWLALYRQLTAATKRVVADTTWTVPAPMK